MESKEINLSGETLVECGDLPEAVAAIETLTESTDPLEATHAGGPEVPAAERPEAGQVETAAETLEQSAERHSETEPAPAEELSAEQILAFTDEPRADQSEAHIRAMVEAAIYITEEPLTIQLMAAALEQPEEKIRQYLDELAAEYEKPGHGLTIKEVAGGYKMATKPEHHEAIRSFVRKLKPPLKLSLAALETLSVIAYKQPITSPEIMEIRGVQGAGVLKTLIDRKLITPAGRKQVVGKPILYKTTRDFLVQFGLKDLSELPTLKEFEELRRLAIDPEPAPEPVVEAAPPTEAPVQAPAEPQAEESAAPEPAPAAESAPGN
jgi:segregation and condensation protein B